MVQGPSEAEFPDMPNNVIDNVAIDYKVSISEMGYILSDLYSRRDCEPKAVPNDVKLEAEITIRMSSDMQEITKLGELTQLTCPDCGGALVKVSNDTIVRYRCYTGHSFTEKALETEQIKGIEDSLWVAIRMLEERRNLLISMTNHMRSGFGNDASASQKTQRAEEIKIHINRLKAMLLNLGGEQINTEEK